MLKLVVVGWFLALSNAAWSALPAETKEGDLIFQESRSAQSQAIQEAQGSPWSHVGILFLDHNQWKVAEAIGPVVKTPVDAWIARGRGSRYVVRRANATVSVPALARAAQKYVGAHYDFYFEWSDDLIYCSELVWKVFHEAGVDLSTPQKFGDLKLDGPLVKRLIKERYEANHKKLNLDEPIVTPQALFVSDALTTVYDSAP